ncbi:MAG: hypothetical protein S4CHLAM102_02890 [Chlamydiia bacterium]|nr:hypothetical protein [Chlamydiia bacterium]
MKKILFLMLAVCASLSYGQVRADDSSGKVVAVYYENWSQYRPPSGGREKFMPDLIDPSICTDIYYAFAYFGFVTKSIDPDNPHLTGDYTVQPVEWNDISVLYPQIQALKEKNPDLKTHISIGGWSFNDPNDPNGAGEYTYRLFSEMAASSDGRSQFIQSAIDYAHQHGFDGIDLDWEYPGDLTRGGTAEDFANFVTLLSEMDDACKSASPALVLSYASAAIVPTGCPEEYHQAPSKYFEWLKDCSDHLDHVNIMAYDYHGAFDVPKLTGVNAPLYHDTNPDSTMYIAKTVENYLAGGVPASKMVLGMPTYGHSFGGVSGMSEGDAGPGKPFTQAGAAGPSTLTPGFLAYFEIADMTADGTLTFGTDSTTSTAYGYNLSTQEWVSFDTPDTIALTAQYINEQGLMGGMFWAVDDDEYQWGDKYPNIRKGWEVLRPSVEEECEESGGSWWSNWVDDVTDSVTEFAEEVSDLIEDVAEDAVELVDDVADVVADMADFVADAVEDASEFVDDVVDAVDDASLELSELGDNVGELVEDLVDDLVDIADDLVEDVIEEVCD